MMKHAHKTTQTNTITEKKSLIIHTYLKWAHEKTQISIILANRHSLLRTREDIRCWDT